MYLNRFGYLNPTAATADNNINNLDRKMPNAASLITEETVKNAVLEFQAFAGLNLTGNTV